MNVRTSSSNLSHRLLIMGLPVLGLVTSYFLAQTIVSSDYKKLGIWIALGLFLLMGLLTLRNWRVGVFVFFVWILLEDFLRKWMGNEMSVYFAKDVLIAITYGSYFLHVRRFKQERFRNPLRVPLLMMFAWACVQSVNPGVTDILVPLVGLRMSFLYVPMLYLGYSAFRDEKELSRFCLPTISLAVLISILGIVQSLVGIEFLNPALAPNLRLGLIRMDPVSKLMVPRPTSTFVDAGRFAQYLFVMVFLGFGVLGYLLVSRPGPSLRRRMWISFCWVVIVVGLFMSGQRATVVWLVLSLPLVGVAYWYGRYQHRGFSRRFSVAKILVLGALGLCLAGFLFPDRFRGIFGFYESTMTPTSQYFDLGTRPTSYWGDIVSAFQSGGLIGHGTGTSSLGLQYVALYGGGRVNSPPDNVEGGYASVIWEWGIVGLLFWLFWTIFLIVKLLERVRQLRLTRFYWLAVSVTLYVFFLLFMWFYLGMQVYQQYVAQAFLWFLVGVVFRLPFAEQEITNP